MQELRNHTLHSPKHGIRFLENKPTEKKIKPEKPLLPAQAGNAAALSRSPEQGSHAHRMSVPILTFQKTKGESEESSILKLEQRC